MRSLFFLCLLIGVAFASYGDECDTGADGCHTAADADVDKSFNEDMQKDSLMKQVLLDLAAAEEAIKHANLTRSDSSGAEEQADALKRFVDLKKLVSWMQPVDKRIARFCFYGCWCLPEGAHGFVAGTGKPVDLVDKSCYNLWQCYECAKEDFNNNGFVCDPSKRAYARTFFYDTGAPNDYSLRGITCTNVYRLPNSGHNQKINCARTVCECDKAFAYALYKYHTFWSISRHRIWSKGTAGGPFIVADECKFCEGPGCGPGAEHELVCCGYYTTGGRFHRRTHNGILECCSQGDAGGFPWVGTLINTVTHCCVNGAVATTNCVDPGSGSGVVSAECAGHVADVVFVVDESGSVSASNFALQIAFLVDVVSDMNVEANGMRIGFVRFNHVASTVFDFNDNKGVVIALMNGIAYASGGTQIGNALSHTANVMGTELNFRSGVKTVAMIFTDGQSSDSISAGRDALKASKGAGEADVVIVSVGIGGGVDVSTMQAIADDPDSKFAIQASGYSDLQDVKDALGLATCT